MSRPENIRRVLLILTSQCNLRCGYCFQNDKKPGRMETKTMLRAIDMAFESKQREVDLTFFGGEPLLEIELLRLGIDYAEKKRRETGKRLTYSISTNGLLLSDEVVELLAQYHFYTQLSFDGVPDMQRLRGASTFATLDRRLQEIGERYPKFLRECLHIGMTLVPSTVAYFADSIEYFLGRGVSEIGVNPSMSVMMDWELDRIEELEEQFDRVLETSIAHYRATEEIPLKVFRGGPTGSLPRPESISMCGVMRGEEPAVDVDGEVHGCATFARSFQRFPSRFLRERIEDMSIGDLHATDFRHRYHEFEKATERAQIFHRKEDKFSGYGRCGDCQYLAACSICPMSIGNLPGNEDPQRVPDFSCAYNLVALKHRDLFWERIDDEEAFAVFSRTIPIELNRFRKAMTNAAGDRK
jgi:sulfatase maturation enzyme AslB (radical SAM superfamily)